MLINWFTILAQIINFLVLVFLLHRFLYGPIIKAMDEREAAVAGRLEEAKINREQAQKEKEEYNRLKQKAEDNRQQMLVEAENEAKAWEKELRQKARQEIEDLKQDWRQSLEQERETFLKEFRIRAGAEIHRILRSILKDLSHRDLEEEMVEVFLERLEQLPLKEKEEMVQLLKKEAPKEVMVRSSRELSQDLQQRVKTAIARYIGSEVNIEFGESRDLICGIELRVKGRKVAWNIDDYLQTLLEELTRLLTEEEEANLLQEQKND